MAGYRLALPYYVFQGCKADEILLFELKAGSHLFRILGTTSVHLKVRESPVFGR
jgi:hypothetical protein